MQIHYIDQCQFGQQAQKPTHLLAANLPELGQELASIPGGQRCRHRGHDRAYGRDGRGGWKTAPLKEYPPALARAMAAALAARWGALADKEASWPDEEEPDFMRFYAPLDPFGEDETLGHDCHRAWGRQR